MVPKKVVTVRVLTAAEKAQAIAETAKWLAEILSGGSDKRIEARVEKAYQALRVLGPKFAQQSVCAVLLTIAQSKGKYRDPIGSVRGRIAALSAGHEFDLAVDATALEDTTIENAIQAWSQPKRRRGAPKKGTSPQIDRWEATLTLFKQCGLAENVTAEALEKTWDRRIK